MTRMAPESLTVLLAPILSLDSRLAASSSAKEENREVLGNLMTLSLLLGLSVGSTGALASQYVHFIPI